MNRDGRGDPWDVRSNVYGVDGRANNDSVLSSTTVHDVRGTNDAFLMRMESTNSPFDVVDSLLGGSSHGGVQATGDGIVRVRYSSVWDVAGERFGGVEIGAGVIEEAPGFLAPNAGDFRVRRSSPVVDMGDPESACDAEPQDEAGGCRIDLGHLGNTPEAWSR